MTTNRDRLDRVEADITHLQEGIKRMEEGQLGMSDKLHQIEAALSKLAGSISASKGTLSFNNYESSGSSQHSRSEEGNRPQFISRSTKLECPKFAGGDPTEWHNRIL